MALSLHTVTVTFRDGSSIGEGEAMIGPWVSLSHLEDLDSGRLHDCGALLYTTTAARFRVCVCFCVFGDPLESVSR